MNTAPAQPLQNNALNKDAFPDLESMRSYKQVRLLLSDLLRLALQAMVVLGRKEAESAIKELMLKLAEDRFTLAVLGQFKRGKSSLMNAIIGKEILPTSVLPLTSAVTILKYGATEKLLINYSYSMLPSQMPVSELAEFVTEKGNPGNSKKIKDAEIQLPLSFLRYGVEFVDTPGIGSVIAANTETTYNFLPQCDAVLFVTGADTPMTSVELGFLENIKSFTSKIFFIVNKIDLVNDDERNEILQFVERVIQKHVDKNAFKIFPVSSRFAMQARSNKDEALYAKSGLQKLEERLVAFLSNEKLDTFLKVTIQKAIKVLDDEAAANVFTQAYAQQRAAALQQEQVKTVHGDPFFAISSVTSIREKLDALQKLLHDKSISHIDPAALKEIETKITTDKNSFVAESPVHEETPAKKEDKQEKGFAEKNCPICGYLADTAFDFFAHWQYSLVTDEQAQNKFAEGLGFCSLHTWQLLAVSSPYGASLGFAKMADVFAEKLGANKYLNGGAVKELVHNSHNCPVCLMLQQEEEKYIQQLSKIVSNDAGMVAYRQSNSACMWHLAMLLNAVENEEAKKELIEYAVQRFKENAEDMRSFALKQDALRRALQNENEKQAYIKTVLRIAGDKRVCMPWALDGVV